MVSRHSWLGFTQMPCGSGRPSGKWFQAPSAFGRKTIMKSMIMSRRAVLGATAAWASVAARPAKAAAEFEFKLGVNTPDTHPLTVRLTEAAKDIASRSSGRLVVTVFPNSQLGGDPEMLSQVR